MKRIITVIAVLSCVLLALTSCQKKAGGAAGEDANKKLVVWSFTDELDGMIKNYFRAS